MLTTTHTSLLRRKWILVPLVLPLLVALWWAFRPEKLWINKKVNEPAPFDATAGPQPVLTGRFESEARQTSGRATIYRKPSGEEYLRLNDFTTSSGPDVHVVLARSSDLHPGKDVETDDLDKVDFGPLKSSQGDQNYDLPAATDLKRYAAVVIYGEQSHAVFGLAKLEPL